MLMIDGYRLRMYAHCGMSYDIATHTTHDEDPRLLADLAARMQRFIDARIQRGYAAAMLTAQDGEICRYELTEPDDAQMVPDDAGILCLELIPAKTVECWNCGDAVRVGESCECADFEDDRRGAAHLHADDDDE